LVYSSVIEDARKGVTQAREIWLNHAGVEEHDQRERQSRRKAMQIAGQLDIDKLRQPNHGKASDRQDAQQQTEELTAAFGASG
jgi:hypothetical protein